MARKRTTKISATEPRVKPITVRLDLSPKDYERLEKQATKRGLNKASTARMVVLEWLDKQEGEGVPPR
jgi:hypothetical protein